MGSPFAVIMSNLGFLSLTFTIPARITKPTAAKRCCYSVRQAAYGSHRTPGPTSNRSTITEQDSALRKSLGTSPGVYLVSDEGF